MDNPRKVLALFVCFMLALMYKQLVLDPFLHGTPQNAGAGQVASPGAGDGQGASAPAAALSSASVTTAGSAPATPDSAITPAVVTPAASAPLSPFPTEKELQAAGVLQVRTATGDFSITLLGGRISKLLLTEYKENFSPDSPQLDLIAHTEGGALPLGVYSGEQSDARVRYSVVSPAGEDAVKPLSVLPGQSQVVVLKGALPDGREITKTLTFHGEGYLADVQVALSAPPAAATPLELEWTEGLSQDSPTLLDPYKISGFTWFDGQKAQREPFAKMEPDAQGQDPRIEIPKAQWLSLTDKYFMTTMIHPDGVVPARIQKNGEMFVGRISGEPEKGSFKLFFGPKRFQMLKGLGFELHRNIDFGWTGFVAAPLMMLLHVFYGIFGNYGVAIVTLTILVKLAIFPLTAASIKQMKGMQDLQPEVKRIRETITDRQQQQIELMALYKKRGVNPMGGCLPMLLQMPIFIGLYSALLLSIELRHAPFAFWIRDLSAPEYLHFAGVSVPVLVVIMTISMIVQQYTTPSQMDPVQKKVMLFMPIMFGFMFANFPAGLTIYMLTNNLISIAQQRALQAKGAKSGFYAAGVAAAGVFTLAFVLAHVGL